MPPDLNFVFPNHLINNCTIYGPGDFTNDEHYENQNYNDF